MNSEVLASEPQRHSFGFKNGHDLSSTASVGFLLTTVAMPGMAWMLFAVRWVVGVG